MAGHDIIVIGGSAGGVGALGEIARNLPAHLQAAVFGVIHQSPQSPRFLDRVLGRNSQLQVAFATDGEAIEHGRMYLAPPDRHLLLENGKMRVVNGPRENGFRPAVDPLFRTAARTYGSRVVGCILSGGLDDGTLGLAEVKEAGGVAVVQDPAETAFPSMPAHAISKVQVDHIATISQIAAILVELTYPRGEEGKIPRRGSNAHRKMDIAERGTSLLARERDAAPPTFICPECGGALAALDKDELLRFVCHVGHSFGPESLRAEHSHRLEMALWTALRVLEEQAALRRHLASRTARGPRRDEMSKEYLHQARQTEAHAANIRELLLAGGMVHGSRNSSKRRVSSKGVKKRASKSHSRTESRS